MRGSGEKGRGEEELRGKKEEGQECASISP